MPLSPLAQKLLQEISLVEHQGARLLKGRTRKVDAALQELREAGLLTGDEVLQVTQSVANPARPEHHLVKVTASRRVLHRIVMDGSHCGFPLNRGVWMEPEESLEAERCRRCFP